MNGLEAIIDRILSDAAETARDIGAQCDAQCAGLLESAKQEADSAAADILGKACEKAAAHLRRTESLAALESRKILLTSRQNLVGEVISRAAAKISSLPDDDKAALYARLLAENATGDESVIFSSADAAIAGQILEDVNRDKGWHLLCSSEKGNFTAGLILSSGFIQTNLTVELLIKNKKPELVSLAAKTLFGG